MGRDDSVVVRKLRALERRLAAVERGQRVAHGASVENAAIEVRDGGGSLRAIVGQQGDGTTGVNVVNGPTPPAPSAPTVEPALAALAVTWDGGFADGIAAPLDWMRCEVHIGATADFTPDQATLRDTVESPQGGTVTVPLPYTEWFVKLRSRTTSGVASASTAAVSGTPRKAATADITAGAVTAETLAADAITGKTVTGGLVTGAIVQTSASGQRVVLNPSAPDPSQSADSDDTVPAVEVHSGAAAQITPGLLVADVDGTPQAYPYTSLHAPSLKRDGLYGYPITAWLQLLSPQLSVRGGAVRMEANSALSGNDQRIGNVRVYGYTGSSRTGASHIEMYCENGDQAAGGTGTGLGARSWAELDGAQVHFRAASTAGDASLYVRPAGVEATGVLTAGNIATGTITITPSAAHTPTSILVSGFSVAGSTFRGYATANTTVPGVRSPVGAAGVTGVGVSSVGATSLLVWVNRENTTATVINWMVIGS